MTFKPNRRFKKRYDRIFENNPMAANIFLLIAELAGERGRVRITEEELTQLMEARFEDPAEYAL